MEDISENALFSSKDAFLNVTIFLSIKRIFILRTVCKKFNSWLSDRFSFAWIKRIQSAFPLSYTLVLKEDMNQQFRRLIVIDSLVDEGHSVSYFTLTNGKPNPHNALPSSYQVPWRKDLILYLDKDLLVYNATTAIITATLPMPTLYEPFFNITDQTIGLLTEESTMKFFRVEGDVLVHERDVTCLSTQPGDQSLIYGDIWIGIAYEENNSAKLNFRSITTGNDVATFELSVPCDYISSTLRPVTYAISHDLVNATYSIFEIDCINLKIIDLYNGQLNEKQKEHFNCGMQLFENENGSYLKIFRYPGVALEIEILDVNSRKIIHRQSYQQQPTKDVNDYFKAWNDLVVFPGSPYYCTLPKSGVFTVHELSTTRINDANTVPDNIEHLHDPYLSISLPEKMCAQCCWLNRDILTCRTYRNGNPRRIFFSISKRAIIGYINKELVDIFIINDTKALAINRYDIYEINFDMSYLQ